MVHFMKILFSFNWFQVICCTQQSICYELDKFSLFSCCSHIGLEPKYLTTVIPYHLENGTPDNQALQVLIKSEYSTEKPFIESME